MVFVIVIVFIIIPTVAFGSGLIVVFSSTIVSVSTSAPSLAYTAVPSTKAGALLRCLVIFRIIFRIIEVITCYGVSCESSATDVETMIQ